MNQTIKRQLVVTEKIRFGSAPIELVPSDEKPVNLISVNFKCEPINYDVTHHVRELDCRDMERRRKFTTGEILADHPDADVEFVNA